MKIIGITGPTGAGKSILRDWFEMNNIPCIDADDVYHKMLIPPSECLDALRQEFGDGIFAPDGTLDRAKLGAIVFSSPEKLELLNRTVLDKVLCRIRSLISEHKKNGYDSVAVDAPTLIESGFNTECSIVISILAPKQVRKQRIMERDSLSLDKAELRVNAQKDDEFYRDHSDVVIVNDKGRDHLEKEISSALAKILG